MKKVLLALGLLAAVAVAAWAQTSGTNTVERNGYYFGQGGSGNRTDADGKQMVVDGASAWDYYAFNHSLFTADTMSIGSYQDSSAFFPTGAARQMYLRIQADIPTGTPANMWVRLAVQARCAYSNPDAADTTLIALWRPTVGANTTSTDSLSYGAVRAGTGGGGVASGNAVAGSDEMVVTLADFTNTATAAPSSGFTSTWIPLADNRGVFLWSPYTAIRIRVLACGTGNTPKITANLVGRP